MQSLDATLTCSGCWSLQNSGRQTQQEHNAISNCNGVCTDDRSSHSLLLAAEREQLCKNLSILITSGNTRSASTTTGHLKITFADGLVFHSYGRLKKKKKFILLLHVSTHRNPFVYQVTRAGTEDTVTRLCFGGLIKLDVCVFSCRTAVFQNSQGQIQDTSIVIMGNLNLGNCSKNIHCKS